MQKNITKKGALLNMEKMNRKGAHSRKALSEIAQVSALAFLTGVLVMTVTARVALAHDTVERSAPPVVELASVSAVPDTAQIIKSQHKAEAESVAKVLYGTALHNTREAQEAVVWLIINRTESGLFPNSIIEVCKQPQQFMGYSDDNPVISNLYEIADSVLNTWRNGGYRIMSPDYLFMSWSADEIILRTSFEENAQTHYWRE